MRLLKELFQTTAIVVFWAWLVYPRIIIEIGKISPRFIEWLFEDEK